SRREPGTRQEDERPAGGERVEQPMDSDGTAKSQRRNARRAAGAACTTRSPDEYAVWQSQMSLKMVAGGAPLDAPSDMSLEAINKS
ncbi:MAG: hypothetical protein V4492_07485, partial [Chlamydiota bacterium]